MEAYADMGNCMRILTAGEVGLVVRAGRSARGWSQTRLADAIGSTRQWVAALERGKPSAEIGLTLRALNALGVTLDVQGPAVTSARAEKSAGVATRGRPVRLHASSQRP